MLLQMAYLQSKAKSATPDTIRTNGHNVSSLGGRTLSMLYIPIPDWVEHRPTEWHASKAIEQAGLLDRM